MSLCRLPRWIILASIVTGPEHLATLFDEHRHIIRAGTPSPGQADRIVEQSWQAVMVVAADLSILSHTVGKHTIEDLAERLAELGFVIVKRFVLQTWSTGLGRRS